MYAEYAATMTAMLKGNWEETKKGSKKALVWNEESDRAFEGTKQALLSAVDLHLLDPDRGFVLRTDGSNYALGAVLEQVLDDVRHVPLAFVSGVRAEGQKRTWIPHEKEAYAIVMAVRKWHGYIALHPVRVHTDHQSLQSWHKEHVATPSGPAIFWKGRLNQPFDNVFVRPPPILGALNSKKTCLWSPKIASLVQFE